MEPGKEFEKPQLHFLVTLEDPPASFAAELVSFPTSAAQAEGTVTQITPVRVHQFTSLA